MARQFASSRRQAFLQRQYDFSWPAQARTFRNLPVTIVILFCFFGGGGRTGTYWDKRELNRNLPEQSRNFPDVLDNRILFSVNGSEPPGTKPELNRHSTETQTGTQTENSGTQAGTFRTNSRNVPELMPDKPTELKPELSGTQNQTETFRNSNGTQTLKP